MKFVMRLGINVFALLIVAYILPGFILADIWSAIVAAVIIGVVNTFVRPIVQILALPITLVTFGMFAIIINVALLWTVSLIVPGFEIAGFLWAFAASILLSLVSWFLHKLAQD